MHEHLGERTRNHPEHFAVSRIRDGFHIANHAYNCEPRASSVESSPPNAFPDRRIVRPKAFCDALADNADERRVSGIARAEITALQDRLADASKIPGRGHARVSSVD